MPYYYILIIKLVILINYNYKNIKWRFNIIIYNFSGLLKYILFYKFNFINHKIFSKNKLIYFQL